jgi:16S rRNA A1518/A1519 N6-dimethyltransferase RsmA/KsgA/DIM1 with predicted DNA glycosylase/AP lyase activity
MTLFEELQSLMIEHRFRPSKKMSQFYCTNEALLHFLVKSSNLKEDDIVLEIGPGTGFLTRLLLEKSKVVAVEYDESMFELLSKKFSSEIKEKKLTLINNDILKEDLSKYKINKVVALPPYHISTDLLIKITKMNVEKAILVLDIGFIEKVMSFEGFTTYNALTVFLSLNSDLELLEKISPTSFFPKPNCVSGVLEVNYDIKNNSEEFFIFLKELFRHKNKDLSRGLKQAQRFLSKELNWGEKQENLFNELEFSNEKIYSLTPEELLSIFEELHNAN